MKKGFTLIELLVVVLIIGILSAVALPQYTKAVEKSRMAQALTLLPSIRQAVDIWVLGNGYGNAELVGRSGGVGNPGELDIDIETLAGCQEGDDVCYGKDFAYDVYCGSSSCSIIITRIKNEEEIYRLINLKSKSDDQWRYSCEIISDESESLCNSLQGQGYTIE